MIWLILSLSFLIIIFLYFRLNRKLKEDFDVNYENVLPNPNKIPVIQDTKGWDKDWQSNIIKYGEIDTPNNLQPLEQIYINPFFPEKMINKPKQNYPDPKKMSISERNAYKFGYPPNMTMQDYVNWLSLFQDTEDLLNLDHKTYYQKLIHNDLIPYIKDVIPPPATKLTPLQSEDYFNAQYSSLPKNENKAFDSFINPQTTVSTNLHRSTILSYNAEDYSDFSQTFDVYGTTGMILNDDLWMKEDPRKLREFIGPTWLKQNIQPMIDEYLQPLPKDIKIN